MTDDARVTIRIDKWLWFARFFKTRGLAAKTVTGGHMRINGTRVSKSAHPVGVGDVLTFPQGREIRVIEVRDPGTRRGPALEAQALYADRTPIAKPRAEDHVVNPRFDGGGRPSGKDRRDMAARARKRGVGPLE